MWDKLGKVGFDNLPINKKKKVGFGNLPTIFSFYTLLYIDFGFEVCGTHLHIYKTRRNLCTQACKDLYTT